MIWFLILMGEDFIFMAFCNILCLFFSTMIQINMGVSSWVWSKHLQKLEFMFYVQGLDILCICFFFQFLNMVYDSCRSQFQILCIRGLLSLRTFLMWLNMLWQSIVRCAAKLLQCFDLCRLLLDEEGVVVALLGDWVVLRFAMILLLLVRCSLTLQLFEHLLNFLQHCGERTFWKRILNLRSQKC